MREEHRSPVVSYDFDDTLFGGFSGRPIYDFVERAEQYHALGCRVIVITARKDNWDNRCEVEYLLKVCGIQNCISKIVFTNHNLKGEYCVRENVVLHIDDCDDNLQDVASVGIKVIDSKKRDNFSYLEGVGNSHPEIGGWRI